MLTFRMWSPSNDTIVVQSAEKSMYSLQHLAFSVLLNKLRLCLESSLNCSPVCMLMSKS